VYLTMVYVMHLYLHIIAACGLEVTFPPHDPSDAGSNPAEVVEFLRTEKFRERSPLGGTLSRLTRVVDLLHVKEPHVLRGPLS
jgi:hypothetical protein